jgi:hypothetical protein
LRFGTVDGKSRDTKGRPLQLRSPDGLSHREFEPNDGAIAGASGTAIVLAASIGSGLTGGHRSDA